MEAYIRACGLYKGEFLPNMIGESWAAFRNTHYRNLYFNCLEEVCQWLNKEERFEEIYSLSTTASEIYPFENWHLWRIDSLIAMNRFREAMDIYEETTKRFFDELNLPPSAEMLERFRYMGEKIQSSSGEIEDIEKRLKETEDMNGAYYCSFPSFVEAYRIVSRTMERSGVSVYIMLCTLKNKREKIFGENEKDREISAAYQEAIRKTLRKGDFYTKYNVGQYLIVLSGISQENCPKVSGRLDEAFQNVIKKVDSVHYKVDYYVASIADIYPKLGKKTRQFREADHMWNE